MGDGLPPLFDRPQIRRLRARCNRNDEAHFLFRRAASCLRERLADVKKTFGTTLVIGARGGLRGPEGSETIITDSALLPPVDLLSEEDYLPFAPERFDLVLANGTLHSVNDLPGALLQMRRVLKPGGLFLGALPGGRTLQELRAALTAAELSLTGGAHMRVLPMADMRDMAGLLQRAGFDLPVADNETVTVTYPSLIKLMHDLRDMGESFAGTARSRAIPPRKLFSEAARIYAAQCAEPDGRLPATMEIIFLSGWKPAKQ